MANVWDITSKEIEDLQGTDGGPFRDFVNRLIHAQAAACNIPASAIATDSRNVQDGGVDCEVRQCSTDDLSNRLREKTCWQYKATAATAVTEKVLRKEVQKAYAAKLIGEGYAYRLCVADSAPAEKQTDWERILGEEIQKIDPNSPKPQVLTSTALAEWASKFPAIVLSRIAVTGFLHLDTWKNSITQATKTYVPVSAWDAVAEQIRRHADLANVVTTLTYPVHADAGVGKTRLVCETLSQMPTARSLVLYTNDDELAANVARFLASHSGVFALLVVDECSQEGRAKIEESLRGNQHRVRVITIANYARATSSPEPTLQHMSNETVDEILKKNFPGIPEGRRRAAVSLASGFVKIAADICEYDISGGLATAEDYYQRRIPDPEMRKVIEAIALVKKVGFRGDFTTQFEDLCKLTGLNTDDAKRRAKQLKDLPGFVAIGGRFFYVTPEAIARIALQSAWVHLIQDNPSEFFRRIPESLLDSFQTRVAQSGNEDFRGAMSQYFHDWFANLTPADLADKKKVERLVALIDTEPLRFLPTLVRLVEAATPEQLSGNSGYSTGGWGPRRALVWLCERLSAFPEHFYDIERILFRLAQNEIEQGISNNATAAWKHLFTLFLSGTSLPYGKRLEALAGRLGSASLEETALALDGLGGIFSTHFSRMVGPAIVAGRIPPPDWHPATHGEYVECFHSAFALYEQIIESGHPTLKEKALDAVTQHVGWFLRRGFLDSVQTLLRHPRLTTPRLPKVFEEIDLFFRLKDHKDEKTSSFPKEYLDKVLAWKHSLNPDDFHSKLVGVVARRLFHFHDDKDSAGLKNQLTELAKQLQSDKALLRQEMEWLTGDQASAAGELGIELGRADSEAALLESVALTKRVSNPLLCRGYLLGLMQSHPKHLPTINAFLDKLETENAELTFDYASLLPAQTDAFKRWMKLYDAKRIPAHLIGALVYGFPGQLTIEHLKQALPRLLEGMPSEERARGAALQFIHQWIYQQKKNNAPLETGETDLWNAIGTVLERAIPSEAMEVYYWTEIMKVYVRINPTNSTRIACELLGEDFSLENAAQEILLLLAEEHPDLVMEALGNKLWDEKDGWKLQIRGCIGLITSLPVQVVMNWLSKAGLEGARKLASSLPHPFVNDAGEAVVPLLTKMVLEHFGADEKVARGFVAGSGVRSYSGDIAGQHLQEAVTAARFLNHDIPAIREWARIEKLSSEEEAERWRQQDAERFL